jgi:hypothetical protein
VQFVGWTIENQGFRNLTQRWSLDIAGGRNYRSILARTSFVLMLANAESILEEYFPGPWQEERKRLGTLGVSGLIGGEPALAAYTPKGELGILSTEDYGDLVRQNERSLILEEFRKACARGETIEGVLRRLDPTGAGGVAPRPKAVNRYRARVARSAVLRGPG